MEGILLSGPKVLVSCEWHKYVMVDCVINLHILQTETKQSKWEMPDELLELMEKVEKEHKALNVPLTGATAYVRISSRSMFHLLTLGISQAPQST